MDYSSQRKLGITRKHTGLKELLSNKKDRKVYDDRKAMVLLIKYKKLNNERARNDLVELCYPIIFAILKRQARKITLNKEALLDNQDLFNECVITTIKCIDGYTLEDRGAKFSTYLWNALERAVLRFVNKHVLKFSNQSNIDDLIRLGDILEDEEMDLLRFNKEEEISSDDHNGLFDLEKDFALHLDKTELKIFILRLKKVKIKNACTALKISMSEYYYHLRQIKTKLEEYLYEKQNTKIKTRKN